MPEEKLIPFKYMLVFYLVDLIWSSLCISGWAYFTFIKGHSAWWSILILVWCGSMSKKKFIAFVRMREEDL